jgi:hypothetical protein
VTIIWISIKVERENFNFQTFTSGNEYAAVVRKVEGGY